MAKKLTPLQKEYKKEIARLRKGFTRYAKQGYIFPEESIGTLPKRITKKSLEKIKQTKPKSLTKFSERVDISTGEIISQPTPKQSTRKTKTTPTKTSQNAVPTTQISTAQLASEEYIPNLSIIDEIKARIEAMPDTSRTARHAPIGKRRNGLLAIFEDTIYSIDDEDMQGFIDYLLQNQAELFSSLQHIEYESKDERVAGSFAHAGRILNYGEALTPMQSELLDVMQEYI